VADEAARLSALGRGALELPSRRALRRFAGDRQGRSCRFQSRRESRRGLKLRGKRPGESERPVTEARTTSQLG
jgi:hypothetical protein